MSEIPENLSWFHVIPTYDGQSAKQRCYISGMPHSEPKLGDQEGDYDDYILRGPGIDFEGYLDISPRVITQTAAEMGWYSPDFGDALETEVKELNSTIKELEAEVHSLQAELERAQLANAKLVIHAEQLGEELGQYYTDVS